MVIYFMIALCLSSLLGADGVGQCLIGEYSGHGGLVYGLYSLPSGEGNDDGGGNDNGGGEGARFLSAS